MGHPAWLRVDAWVSIVMPVAAVCAGIIALYLTRETIELRSVHGRALLVEITGSLGSSKVTRDFLENLVKRIDDVRAGAKQSKPHFLRDEMREHRRLWEAGILSDAAYDSSKRRILQAHG